MYDAPVARRFEIAAVAVLLLAFVVPGFLSLRGDSATSDETAHLPAGASYLDRLDFRMNPEHPPLAKAWAAAAARAFGTLAPDYGSAAWRRGDQWAFGYETLFGAIPDATRRDPNASLTPARAAMLALGALLGVVVWRWSRALWGVAGGLLSLFLFSLSPTLIAHARLVTTDLPAALGYAATAFAFWRFLESPGTTRALLTGAALGASLAAKFSAVLLGPALLVAGGIWVAVSPSDRRRARAAAVARGLAIAFAVAWACVWAAYGFRYSASSDPSFHFDWEARAADPLGIPAPVRAARAGKLFPESWLYGITSARQSEIRLAYLDGEASELGWHRYFPEAFLWKTPPALPLLAAWGVIGALSAWKRRPAAATVLGTVFVVYAAVSIASRLNIGHRHLAPLEPLLFVACGSVATIAAGRARKFAAAALLAGYASSSVSAYPGYLAYFNVLAGGKDGGAEHLLDSNLDWGQDLGRLARWMREHDVATIDLAYFGTADPKAYGVRYRAVYFFGQPRPEASYVKPASGELVAVSRNFLHGLFTFPDSELASLAVGSRMLDRATAQRFFDERDAAIYARRPYPHFGAWAIARGLLDPERVAALESRTRTSWFRDLRRRGARVGRAGDSIEIYRAP